MKNITDAGKWNDLILVWIFEILVPKQPITFLGNSYSETQM